MTWHLEPERGPDVDSVRVVVTEAFGRNDEADLVERLRRSNAWIAELALVARDGTDPAASVIGFAAMTRMFVGGQAALALAPVAVAPACQRRGVGSALVREGAARAWALGERLVIVLGDPRYYARFGFVAAASLRISGPYPSAGPAFQALVLPGSGEAPTGRAVYPAEFEDL